MVGLLTSWLDCAHQDTLCVHRSIRWMPSSGVNMFRASTRVFVTEALLDNDDKYIIEY